MAGARSGFPPVVGDPFGAVVQAESETRAAAVRQAKMSFFIGRIIFYSKPR
jgi:hypothetical protein